jgi:hypothetical protein
VPSEVLERYCSDVIRVDTVINSSGGVQLFRLNSARLPPRPPHPKVPLVLPLPLMPLASTVTDCPNVSSKNCDLR